jgi:membrane protein required for beta-lactamase induction
VYGCVVCGECTSTLQATFSLQAISVSHMLVLMQVESKVEAIFMGLLQLYFDILCASLCYGNYFIQFRFYS